MASSVTCLVNIPHALKKHMHASVAGVVFYKLSIRLSWLVVLFISSMSLPIFYLVLSISGKGMLKSLTLVVELHIPLLLSIFALCSLKLCYEAHTH